MYTKKSQILSADVKMFQIFNTFYLSISWGKKRVKTNIYITTK